MIRKLAALILPVVFCLLSISFVTVTYGQSQELLIGINYDPVPRGNDPNNVLTDEQIDQDLKIIAEKFTTLRIYQAQGVGEQIVRIAEENRLRVIVQAWLTSDSANNDAEIASAISLATQYPNVVAVIVGSDVLSRGDLAVDALVQYIAQVREAIPANIPVGYADVFLQWIQNPTLDEAVEWVGLNSYGFLDCQGTQGAIQYSINQWALLVSNPAFAGKQIMLTEAGWPTDGANSECQNQEAPSVATQSQFITSLLNNATAAQLNTLIFEFADSPWRCAADASARYGCHWGLVDMNRSPKDAWLALPAAVHPAEVTPIRAVVASDNRGSINCRVNPGLEQTVFVTIDNDEPVEILDRSSVEEWVKVRYQEENECWVHHSLLLVDGRPLPTASQSLAVSTADLEQYVLSADITLCAETTPSSIANKTWTSADVITIASCVNNLQLWMPDAANQQANLISLGVCDTQPSADQAETQRRFQTIWALDNIAIAYYNLGLGLRRAGQFTLAHQAFSKITNDLSCAWAYDSTSADVPYFWSIAQKSHDQIATLPLETNAPS